jgi:hypothetical protein
MSQSQDRSWNTGRLSEDAWSALAEGLPASKVWSLLLNVMAQRAAQRTPAGLVNQWERDAFVRPAPIDQRTLVALDGHLLAAAADFEAIELSPLAPLGVCSIVGPTSQNKIVSALRGTEVVSDPTNLLALVCAERLRADVRQVVRLATCHRCVRAQPFPNRPGFSRHFRIFCLATAGHEQKDQVFVTDALVHHVTTHLAALDRLEQHGYNFPHRRVTVLASPARAPLGDRIADAIQRPRPRPKPESGSRPNAGAALDLPVAREPLDHAYYDGLRFMISVRNAQGDDVPLIDGGAFDWLGKLTSNRKLVLVASGMGAQLAAYAFRTAAASSESPV